MTDGIDGAAGARGPRGRDGRERRLWPYVLVILVAMLVGVTATGAKQGRDLKRAQRHDGWARYDSSFSECERGNRVRADQIRIAAATKALADEFGAFLTSSAAFRRASGEADLALKSAASRDKILKLSDKLRLPAQVVCLDVIFPPPYPRP